MHIQHRALLTPNTWNEPLGRYRRTRSGLDVNAVGRVHQPVTPPLHGTKFLDGHVPVDCGFAYSQNVSQD
jgi:hypothetical protein